MKFLLFGVLSFIWVASLTAYPLNNDENVALDTAHEAHLGVIGGVEKPPETEVAPLELVKSAEGAVSEQEVEPVKVQNDAELKKESAEEAQAVAPAVQAVAPPPAPEQVAVVPQLVENVEPAPSKSVVALVPAIAEPEAAVVAIVEEPVKLADIDEERIARAYQYQLNNYGYDSWPNARQTFENYGAYVPYGNQYQGFYPHENFLV